MKYGECDVVRLVKLGPSGQQNTAGTVAPQWAIGREGIFDSSFPDGEVVVWLEEPADGWRMWIFDDDLEPTGKTAPHLPDYRD